MFRILPLLLLLLTTIISCDSDSSRPEPENGTEWVLKPDSVNLGLLVLDYQTYALEGANLSYFPPCGGCGTDSLPLLVEIETPSDFGSVVFRYAPTGDTVFAGTVIWLGSGEILYPTAFVPADSMKFHADSVAQPEDPDRYEFFVELQEETVIAKSDSAWQAISSVDLVHTFAESDFRVGFHLYPPALGIFEPSLAKWIVFLYGEGD